MKIALNLSLVLVSVLLVYLLIESIRKPILFNETRELREIEVRDRLKQTAELQKIYKSLTDKYAVSYDSLKYVLSNDTFLVDKVTGDKFDSTQVVITVQIKVPAKDSLQGFIKKSSNPNMSIDEFFEYISTVPFSGGQKFYMQTGEAIVEGTDSLMTPTFEAGTVLSSYLSEFDSASHVIYDPDYSPSKIRKIGDLYKPTVNGNW